MLNLRSSGHDWRNGGVLSWSRRSRKYGRMSKPSQPLSLSRFIAPNAAERSIKRFHRRTVERRDDNVPLLIAIIPLYYGAFRDPTQRELWRSAHCILVMSREKQYSGENLRRIYMRMCSRICMYATPPDFSPLDSHSKYQRPCPKHFLESCDTCEINSAL